MNKLLEKCGTVRLGTTNGCKCQSAEQSNEPILDETDPAVATYSTNGLVELLLLLKHLELNFTNQPFTNLGNRIFEATRNIRWCARNDPDRIQKLIGVGGCVEGLKGLLGGLNPGLLILYSQIDQFLPSPTLERNHQHKAHRDPTAQPPEAGGKLTPPRMLPQILLIQIGSARSWIRRPLPERRESCWTRTLESSDSENRSSSSKSPERGIEYDTMTFWMILESGLRLYLTRWNAQRRPSGQTGAHLPNLIPCR